MPKNKIKWLWFLFPLKAISIIFISKLSPRCSKGNVFLAHIRVVYKHKERKGLRKHDGGGQFAYISIALILIKQVSKVTQNTSILFRLGWTAWHTDFLIYSKVWLTYRKTGTLGWLRKATS